MDRQRWLQIEDLLQEALDLQPHQRDAFLEQACHGDAALLSEVEALLKREAVAGSFMESPAIASLPRVEPPSRISHYRIEKLVGSGGMGEVFKGHDETLRRVVALKMLTAEFTSDAERVRRFEREALAASRLNHPNIITIFEVTDAGEAHFIVEEFVEGRTLRDLLRDSQSHQQRPLELDRALDIAIQIARALKAAHTAWIIHRDVKPENVMVREDGLVKVLDFGIAKLGDERGVFVSSRDDMSVAAFQSREPSLTVPGAIMGTASYMSPEQARGEPLDGRTDLFSLGLVLYEMVTGVQPGRDIKFDNTPKELQRILRRALRSDREERYASAGEFLEDLTRLRRRRENRTARRIALISALAVVVALGIAGIAAFLSVNETWEETVFRDGHTAAARRAVFSPDGKLLVSVGEDHKVIVWDFARRMALKTLTEHTARVTTVAFSPDGKWFVTGGQDQTAILWNAADLKKELVWNERGPVTTAIFSPDASLLAYATDTVLILRETKSWTKAREIPGGIGSHGNYVFLDNSRLIVDCRGNTWEVATGHKRNTSNADWAGNWFALAPDGKRTAVIDPHGYLKTFDFSHQTSILTQPGHHDHGRAIEYSPDGKLIASGAERVLLWDATTATRIAPLEYESVVWSVAFSPDGRWLVSTHGDGSVVIWDVVNRELEANLRQHSGGVRALALSPDGKRLASASEDQSVILWDAESGRKESVLTVHQTRVGAVAFSSDGTWLVSSDQSGDVIRHEFGRAAPRWTANVLKDLATYCLAISPDHRFIATSFAVYGAETGDTVLYDINSAWRGVYSAAFTSDGTRLVGVNDRGYVVVLDTRTWEVIERQKWSAESIVTMSVSPDGNQIVTGDDGKVIRLGTINPLRQTAVIGQHTARIKAVAFSPDGKQVASAGDDKMVALWDVNRRKLVTTIGTHTSPIYALAFSPDGKRLFTGEHDRSVRQYTRHRSLWGFSLD